MRYHINEILERGEFALFDAPGDFQLFLRKDIFAMDGFDERYNLGWHMDSNLCKRFNIKYGVTLSADKFLAGWHCNHTRTQSIAHGAGRKSNSWDDVVQQIVRPDVPEQRDTWGLVNERLEEIRLHDKRQQNVLSALNALCPTTLKEPYHFQNFLGDWVPCPPEHLKPYLADILYPFHRANIAGYMGYSAEQFVAFVEVWKALGFTGKILLIGREQRDEFAKASGLTDLQCVSPEEADEQCTLFVAGYKVWNKDSYQAEKEENERLMKLVEYMLQLEQQRVAIPTHAPRKFIVTNGNHLEMCKLLQTYTNMQETPFGTRIRHGYVGAKKAK